MEVDTNTINRVIYNEQNELQDIADIYIRYRHTEHRYILKRYKRDRPGY